MEFENYKKYGKCVALRNGGKKMLITVDLGPRIIFYGYEGGGNIFFEDLEDSINRDSDFIRENLQGKGIWHIYGGHRLWKSPEYEDTYSPDNTAVKVVEKEDRIDFIPEVETTTGLQKILSVKMHEDGNAEVTHTLVNVADKATPPIAIWTLSVMDKGAVAEIQVPKGSYIRPSDRRISAFLCRCAASGQYLQHEDKIGIRLFDKIIDRKFADEIEQIIYAEFGGKSAVIFSVYVGKHEYSEVAVTRLYLRCLLLFERRIFAPLVSVRSSRADIFADCIQINIRDSDQRRENNKYKQRYRQSFHNFIHNAPLIYPFVFQTLRLLFFCRS